MKNKKYKNGLRLWVLMGMAAVFGACAYDPAEEVSKDRVESQSRNDSGEGGKGEIPFDLVVSDRLVLTGKPEKIRRLTILENAVLSTNGQELKLVVEELVSSNGTIDTTPITPIPKVGANGLSAGLLSIKVEHARGRLTLIAGGQDGGLGRKRSASKKRVQFAIRGGSGGDSSPILFELTEPADLLVSTDPVPGKAVSGGKDGSEKPICLRLGNAQIGDCRDFENLTQRGAK